MPSELNIADVNLGFSLLGTPDLIPEIQNRQSPENGSVNLAVFTPRGLVALVAEINGMIAEGRIDKEGRRLDSRDGSVLFPEDYK